MNYFNVYSKLNQYINEYNEVISSSDQITIQTQNEYNKLKKEYDTKLNVELNKLSHIEEDIRTYINISKLNIVTLPNITITKPVNLSLLHQMMFSINKSLRNDPKAYELYKEATAQLNGLQNQKVLIKQRINAEFEKVNPLKKMQSLMVIACKVIRVFYAILTKGVVYNPAKMLEDIKRPSVYLQAA